MRRRHPAKGVFIFRGQPTIVFLTVCTQNRTPCLANTRVHDALVASWDDADAWLVGCYLIMPDHIHLFVRRQMRNVRSSIGSASGSASFDVDAVRMRRGFNRAVSIIAYGEVKPMARNGSMFRQIRFVPAWSSTPTTIGHIKAF